MSNGSAVTAVEYIKQLSNPVHVQPTDALLGHSGTAQANYQALTLIASGARLELQLLQHSSNRVARLAKRQDGSEDKREGRERNKKTPKQNVV
jgi:hypothetical protein